MKSKSQVPAILSIIFVNIMWGLSFIASKFAMAHGLQTFSLTLVRYVVAPLVLLPLMLFREGGLRFPQKDWLLMVISGMFGVTIYYFFENNGVQRTTAANASLIVASIPVFTMLSGVIFHRARLSWIHWVGAAVSLFGVYLIVSSGTEGSSTLVGNLFMIGACISWVGYIETTDILLKRNHSSLEITFWQSVFSLITLLPLGLKDGTDWVKVEPAAYLAAGGFLGIICSAVCFLFYAYSIQKLSPINSSIYINLNPLSAALGSVFILKETILPVQIVGGVLIIVSIFLVNLSKSKAKTSTREE